MKTSRWWGLSLLIHGFAALVFWTAQKALQEPVSPPEVVEFEIQNLSVQQKFIAPSNSATIPLQKVRRVGEMNLFDQGYTQSSAAKEATEAGSETVTGNFKDDDNYSFGSGSFLGSNDQWEFYRQIFENIDSQLLFDSLLAQYNHFGSVYVEFEVDAQGHFVETKLKAWSVDPILKVHAMRALRKALQGEFAKGKWNPSTKVSVLQAKFEFLQGDSSQNYLKQKEFGKPVFVFKRFTSEKPIPNNLADQLTSGGIDYDLFAAAERWQKYNKKKKLRGQQFDPFSNYRVDRDYEL